MGLAAGAVVGVVGAPEAAGEAASVDAAGAGAAGEAVASSAGFGLQPEMAAIAKTAMMVIRANMFRLFIIVSSKFCRSRFNHHGLISLTDSWANWNSSVAS